MAQIRIGGTQAHWKSTPSMASFPLAPPGAGEKREGQAGRTGEDAGCRAPHGVRVEQAHQKALICVLVAA